MIRIVFSSEIFEIFKSTYFEEYLKKMVVPYFRLLMNLLKNATTHYTKISIDLLTNTSNLKAEIDWLEAM